MGGKSERSKNASFGKTNRQPYTRIYTRALMNIDIVAVAFAKMLISNTWNVVLSKTYSAIQPASQLATMCNV